ncbi:30S ribosomal protein S6 [Candidatus Uhrbacteria bacterium]|nr:30S ribosomal protein S6 [Candidatus Uhrbacteria bacterium]
MQHYELLVIISASQTESEIQGVEERLKVLVTEQGAEILRAEVLGKVKLAYPLGNLRHALYYFLVFKSEPTLISSLRQALKLFDGIARFEIEKTTEASANRLYQLISYQEPVVDRDREREERPRAPRMPVRAAPARAAKPMSEAEVNAQIEKILEEKVL